jgi:catechol 2,3-dioxygenase-like lactoylglutathione lyase family enzyme
MNHPRSLFAQESVDQQRRRLLGALGGAGVSAVVLGGCATTSSGGDSRGLVRATAVNHISYAVTNYARTRDFYVELLGMKLAWDNGRMCSVEFGDPAKPEGIYIVPVKPGEKAAVSHIGYSIDNFPANKEKIAAELKRMNTPFKGDTEWGWTLDDPSGYTIHFIAETGIFPGAAEPCAVMASEKCKAADAAGLKNLANLPKPSGKGFKATAYSHIVQCVDDIVKTSKWYQQMFSMKEIYYKPDEPNAQAMLRFGIDTLYLRNSKRPGNKPYFDHFAFEIENYEQNRVEAELKRRGYNPLPDSKLGWTIQDPEGMRIEIAGKGLPEYIAGQCKGRATDCPGGPRG